MNNIHIVFGHSAAVGLREALTGIRVEEQILNCWGDYQAGPLAGSVEARIDWLCDLYYDPDVRSDEEEIRTEYIERYKKFRDACLRDDVFKTVWYSKVCAKDYCGYLEFLHCGRANANLIQAVELSSALPKQNARLALSVGAALPEYFVKAFPSRRSVTESEQQSDMNLWTRLRNENAALRVVDVDGLVSAEISYFDEMILSHVTTEFQKAARVIGNALGYVDGSQHYVQGNSDLFYFSRLKQLHLQGKIDWHGSLEYMREAQVKLRHNTAKA